MSSRLTPIRLIEAKRLLTHLVSQEPFDADRFVELLAGVMIDTPEIVTVAARQLAKWNSETDTDNIILGHNVFYTTVAEVVLNAAAIYRGETSEEPAPREATQADFDGWRRVRTTLRSNRDCLLRAAGGSVSKGAWEAQVAACSRTLAELDQLLSNAGLIDSDKEV